VCTTTCRTSGRRARSRWMTGAILMKLGRVPNTYAIVDGRVALSGSVEKGWMSAPEITSAS